MNADRRGSTSALRQCGGTPPALTLAAARARMRGFTVFMSLYSFNFGFIPVATTGARKFFADAGVAGAELRRLEDAWSKAVQLHITLLVAALCERGPMVTHGEYNPHDCVRCVGTFLAGWQKRMELVT